MHHFKHRLFGDHIGEIYLTQVIYGVGIALIGVFIPIYLLTLGFTIKQALLYLIVDRLMMALLSPLAADLSFRIGLKKTTLVRIPFMVASFLTLYALPSGNVHFLVPAVLAGIAEVLYWVPMNTLFMRHSHQKTRGSEVGLYQALRSVFKIAAPAIGGVIAVSLGFPVLVLIALAMISLSTIPLFVWPEEKTTSEFRWKDMWDMRHHSFIGGILIDGFSFVPSAYLFPLLIYFTLGQTESVGYIVSIGTLAFAISGFVFGKKLDKVDRMKYFRIAALLFALTIFVRPFIGTFAAFALIIIAGAIANGVFATSHDTLLFDAARKLKDKADEFIVVREMFLNVGRAAMLGLLLFIPWWYGFFIAAGLMVVGTMALHEA